jgi:hypothetical protein
MRARNRLGEMLLPSAQSPRSAILTGVARNCAEHLPGVLSNLQEIERHFEEVTYQFAVSDSIDATEVLLRAWLADGRRGCVKDLGHLQPTYPLRTERIAAARNSCLEHIAEMPSATYLVVVDLDEVMAGPLDGCAVTAALRFLESGAECGGVFANALPRYYDIWALRHDHWCPDDCWHAIWDRHTNEDFQAAKVREVFTRQIEVPLALPPIEVRSAFGGMGIYKTRFTPNARYRGLAGQSEISEHVPFNRQVRENGGRLFIFPMLTVVAPGEHLYRPCDVAQRWQLEMYRWQYKEARSPSWRRLFQHDAVNRSGCTRLSSNDHSPHP